MQNSDSKKTKTPPIEGTFYRMKRKSNGWVVERLQVTGGKVSLSELGDWDLKEVTERKLLMRVSSENQ